jgi:hypothetical protein
MPHVKSKVEEREERIIAKKNPSQPRESIIFPRGNPAVAAPTWPRIPNLCNLSRRHEIEKEQRNLSFLF